MVTDHALIKVAPLMASILTQDAPSVRLDISSVGPESDYDRLRDGEADLMISFLVLQPPPSFKSMKLFSERLVVMTRPGRFGHRAKLTLQEYASADHALVAPRGGWVPGPTDQLLAEKGLKRKVRMAIPHYLAAPYCAAFSDLLVTVPESVADECIKVLPLTKFELPLDTRPFVVSMVWHDRNHDDPAHRWLRQKIKAGYRPRQ
jgi:DNA-binding transcriptional LysR family regulator